MIHAIQKIVDAEHIVAKIFRYSVHSSVYLALGGVGLSVFSSVALNIPHHIGAYAISFLMIYAMYNMNRYSDMQEDLTTHPTRRDFVIKYRKYIEYSGFAAVIVSILLAYGKNLNSVYLIGISMFLAILYSFRWIPKSILRYPRLKDIPLVKNIVVAFCWAIITTGVTLTYSNSPFTKAAFFVGFIVFTRFFINTVVFDMRDVKGDEKHGTQTLPVLLGLERTRMFLFAYLTSLVILTFFATADGTLPLSTHLVNLTSLQAYYYIYLTNKKVSMHTLCDVVADGEFKVMGLVSLFAAWMIK
jgi:4-hydroxybenzoate polyprenyltransferase